MIYKILSICSFLYPNVMSQDLKHVRMSCYKEVRETCKKKLWNENWFDMCAEEFLAAKIKKMSQ